MARRLDGSLEVYEEQQGIRPPAQERGARLRMMRGAERRAYRIMLVAAALVAALILRACSISIESGIEGHYSEVEATVTATATPGAKR